MKIEELLLICLNDIYPYNTLQIDKFESSIDLVKIQGVKSNLIIFIRQDER